MDGISAVLISARVRLLGGPWHIVTTHNYWPSNMIYIPLIGFTRCLCSVGRQNETSAVGDDGFGVLRLGLGL